MTLKIVPRSRRFSEGHDPSENQVTRLVCTCPDASTEGAHFSFLVPTIYFIELWSSAQALKSAHLRRMRPDKCRKVLKGRGSRQRVMPTRDLGVAYISNDLRGNFLNFFQLYLSRGSLLENIQSKKPRSPHKKLIFGQFFLSM